MDVDSAIATLRECKIMYAACATPLLCRPLPELAGIVRVLAARRAT